MKKDLSWLGILTILRDQGVASIKVCYAGSGDSGAIEAICYMKEENTPRIEINEEGIIKTVLDPSSVDAWNHNSDIEPVIESNIKSYIEDQCYSHLMCGFSDWYNNDGGEGVILIDTKTGEWFAENGTHYTHTDYEYHSGIVLE